MPDPLQAWSTPQVILDRNALPRPWTALGPVWPIKSDDATDSMLMACRDDRGRQHIVHLAVRDGRILDLRTILRPGDAGHFDQDGVGYPVLQPAPDGFVLWFVGWRRLGGVIRFQNQVGRARLDADLNLVERHRAPWLPLTDAEPIGSGSLCIADAPGEPLLLYTSFIDWQPTGGDHVHRYRIVSVPLSGARAPDRRGDEAIPLEPGEYALGHPSVLPIAGGYLCAFTARGRRYRLFMASSRDGRSWTRWPQSLAVPEIDGCRDAQAYPRLTSTGGRVQMLFGGDSYGTGTLFRSAFTEDPETFLAAGWRKPG